MPRLIWSPESLDDLRNIAASLAPRNARAGLDALHAIRAGANRLTDYPRIGRAIDEPFRVLGIRTTPYLIIYRVDGEAIDVIRVRHRREDWLSIEGEI